MGTIESRIRGIEQEWALNFIPPTRSGYEINSIINTAIRALEAGYIAPGVEWRVLDEVGNLEYEQKYVLVNDQALNRFRVYNDSSHLELSTYSYRRPMDAVISNLVSEIFAYWGASAAQHVKRRQVRAYKNNMAIEASWELSRLLNRFRGTLSHFSPFKRMLLEKPRRIAYGTHGNICVSRRVCNLNRWTQLIHALEPYMITRILLIGGGDFVPTEMIPHHMLSREERRADFKYVISPRAMFLTYRTSLGTTEGKRGLFNERCEPHANPRKYWRYHDINLEGQRCVYQQYLTDCAQALVFAAYEKGYLKRVPRVAGWEQIKVLSKDTAECRWQVELKGGQKVDAVADILEGTYLAAIEDMLTHEGELSKADKIGFNVLKATLKELGQRTHEESLYYGLDWVTKKSVIEDKLTDGQPCDKCGRDSCTHKALVASWQYTLIDRGVLHYLDKTVDWELCDCLFDPRDSLEFVRQNIPWERWDRLSRRVTHALTHAPDDTRDWFASEVLKRFPVRYSTWGKLYFDEGIIHLDEPFMLTREEFGDKLRQVDSVSQLLAEVKRLYPRKVYVGRW